MTARPRQRAAADGECVVARTVDALPEQVFALWTDADRLARWWGPHGFTNPVCVADARPGGALRIHMRAPDGTVHPMTGVFRELAAPERIVFTSIAEDGHGRPLLQAITTVTFAAEGHRTRLVVHTTAVATTPAAAPMIAGMEAGWTQSLERLDALAAAGRG